MGISNYSRDEVSVVVELSLSPLSPRVDILSPTRYLKIVDHLFHKESSLCLKRAVIPSCIYEQIYGVVPG